MGPNFSERVSLRFLRHVVATPAGRAYILQQVADAESSDEGAIFDHLLARVDDPELRRLVKRHAEDAKDEDRHLKSCHAIARRYAPDALTHAETLARFRRAEAEVFTETSSLNMDHILAHGLAKLSPPQRAFWRGFGQVARATGAQ